MNFSAVILAGGKSSRMGRDKAWLEVGGQTLLARQIGLAREIGAAEVFISGRPDADYSAFGCRVLQDKFPDAGPLAGIERALDAAKSPMLLVFAVDLPGMGAEFLRRLAAHCTENLGAIPRFGENIEPLVAFYPKAAISLMANLLDASFPLTTALSPGERLNRSQSAGKLVAANGSNDSPQKEIAQLQSPLSKGAGQGEGKGITPKTASAKHFAGQCVQLGLARFVELPAGEAKYFANWNSPADLASMTVNAALPHEN